MVYILSDACLCDVRVSAVKTSHSPVVSKIDNRLEQYTTAVQVSPTHNLTDSVSPLPTEQHIARVMIELNWCIQIFGPDTECKHCESQLAECCALITSQDYHESTLEHNWYHSQTESHSTHLQRDNNVNHISSHLIYVKYTHTNIKIDIL